MGKNPLNGAKTLVVTGILDELDKDAVLREVNIVSLFASFNVVLEKKGKSYMGLCPWHNDSNPSLSVDPEKKLYHCFGCGESGDAITLVQKMKSCSFKEALSFLKSTRIDAQATTRVTAAIDKGVKSAPRIVADAGQGVETKTDTAAHNVVKAKEPAQDENSPAQIDPLFAGALLSVVSEHYHKRILSSKEANAYLEKRGLANVERIVRFGIGYADGSVEKMLSPSQRAECVKIGILNENDREHFHGCITIPIKDDLEHVVGMYGRHIAPQPPQRGALDKESEEKSPAGGFRGSQVQHLYLKGAHKGVFNRKASKVYNEIILTESIIDALSLVALGFENTQSLYGTNGFTDEHLQILKADRVKMITLALDNDEPGRAASEKLTEKLRAEGFAVKVIFPPRLVNEVEARSPSKVKVKDWNEYLLIGGSADVIKESIAHAEIFPPTDIPSELGAAGTMQNMHIAKEGLYHLAATSDVAYRISGVKDVFVGSLRVAIKASPVVREDAAESHTQSASYVDTLDLYSARGRANFALHLSKAIGVESSRVEKDLVAILEYFEGTRDKALFTSKTDEEEAMSEEERQMGIALLKDENLFERVVADMETLGYVGEDVNKKLLYLAASSRILDDPMSVLILSQSASGKSFLVDTVKKLIPQKDVVAVTSLSDQALNYVDDLMHKFLVLGEAVHSDSVEHQIREMLSGKELSRLVATKDEKSGILKSVIMRTPVIVSAVMSGTNYAINPENASRCFVIAADESREQTKRIHVSQRRKYTLERYAEKENSIPAILKTHHAAQRLLKKVRVINPFAQHLDFPDSLMRSRRDHDRFMDLIACVAFVRQYQKEEKIDGSLTFIECDLKDYEIAYEIMVKGVLSQTMGELPSGSLLLYEEIRRVAKETAKQRGISPTEVHFIQRDLRDKTGLGGEFIKKHLRGLVEYEYVQIVSGRTRGTRCSYRLRVDEPAETIDYSMIPSPEQMEHIFKTKSGYSGYSGYDQV